MEKLEQRQINARIYRYSVQVNQYFKDAISKEMLIAAKAFNIQAKVRFSHYYILCELYHSEQPLYLTTISQKIGVKLPNVSKLVNELIDCQLVERCSFEPNKRIVLVQLTELGRKYSQKLVAQVEPIHDVTYSSDEVTKTVYEYYKKMHDSLFEVNKDKD